MGALLTSTFYEIDAERPTIRTYSHSPFHQWAALSAALANHYGADTESFHTAEVDWNGEYAELVNLDGRIVGALDRAISTADVAAINGVPSMQKRAFINRIRSLYNIEGYLLPELTGAQQLKFSRDPLRYFLDADEVQSDAIMREVERRQTFGSAYTGGDLSTAAVIGHPADRSPAKVPENGAKTQATAKPPRAKRAKSRVEGQRELLLPIAGGNAGNKPASVPATGRKAS